MLKLNHLKQKEAMEGVGAVFSLHEEIHSPASVTAKSTDNQKGAQWAMPAVLNLWVPTHLGLLDCYLVRLIYI